MSEDNKLRKIVSPDVDARKEIRQKLNDSAYFIIIVLISMLVVFIPPLFMGCLQLDIGLAFPKNAAGWILWSIMNISTAIANISLLILFKMQAKKNARKHPNYIRANEILNRISKTKVLFIPRSPREMDRRDYIKKTVAIVISTLSASITITSLILNFDWMTLLSNIISVIIALILSWVTMLNNETYWTEEYILYAEMKERELMESESAEITPSEETQVPQICTETAQMAEVSNAAEENSSEDKKHA